MSSTCFPFFSAYAPLEFIQFDPSGYRDTHRLSVAHQQFFTTQVSRPGIDRSTYHNGAERFEVRPTADTHFGWLRTRLSVERTMMSWVRTAVSLIDFGFAIVQFFERMQGMPGTRPAIFPDTPKYLGLSLISCGILALAVSIWQYNWTVRYLRNEPFARVAGLTGCGKRR